MKRLVFLFSLITIVNVVAKADIAPTVMLSHNGVRTMYMYNEVQKAVDAAVEGDTIYLSNGMFEPFNVNKRIMVRGTGEETVIQGDCKVSIAGNTKIGMPVLDALTFTGDVLVTNAYKQFTIRKCQMNNLDFTENAFYDVKLDRCYIQGVLNLTQNVKEFNCFNTKIFELKPYDYIQGNAYFDHCNIRQITDTIRAVFDNCVLRYCKANVKKNYYGVCIGGSVLNYCIYPKYASSNTSACSYSINIGESYPYDNCFFYNTSVTFNNCYQVEVGASSVVNYQSSSYLGIDNTMVGCYGGQHPYKRTPDLPRVTKNSVAVDAVNKKLTVTLTVTKE